MAKLIGSAPNQISTNGDLGSMAFEDKKNYATTSSPIYQPFRNIIINGDMSIAQRGTTFTSAADYTLDRWHLNDSTSGVFTVTQSTTVPSGQGFAKSYKLDCTTADASPSADEYLIFNQRIEGQNLQYLKKGTSNAESLTLSFWVRSNKTGTYIAELRDGDNTRHNTIAYTISSADTWEKKTIIFNGDTTGALDNDNSRSFDVNFWLLAGSTFSSGTLTSNTWSSITNANRAVGQVNLADSTANEWYITGVQLEAGTTASDFEFLPFDVNLQRCYRYYQKSFLYSQVPAQNIGTNDFIFSAVEGNATAARGSYIFSVEMRTAPTITTFNPFAANSSFRQPNGSNDFAVASVASTAKFFYIATASSGTTSLHGHFTADAEL